MNEAFHFLAWSWDVTTAKAYAEGRKPTGRLDPDVWRGYLGAIRIDDTRIGTVDLSVPLIAVLIPNAGPFIIDGWHRIARALRDGVPKLQVVLLTAEEEYACRIHGGDKVPAVRLR
ncbi:hypothetical protein IMZ11_26800 [Microtetraspora sp. AC03309]|uniref:hypothetical protein n=1 Tax=Microtetraspora sp. AC03309 TaxID=2779376 RepID=UPI001E5ABF7A|nr:hypothetical protein [Microtetraspora sp. AC03309]MCC5579242.1 hypothetical protein [Microtetraspora sp. AC03309]